MVVVGLCIVNFRSEAATVQITQYLLRNFASGKIVKFEGALQKCVCYAVRDSKIGQKQSVE